MLVWIHSPFFDVLFSDFCRAAPSAFAVRLCGFARMVASLRGANAATTVGRLFSALPNYGWLDATTKKYIYAHAPTDGWIEMARSLGSHSPIPRANYAHSIYLNKSQFECISTRLAGFNLAPFARRSRFSGLLDARIDLRIVKNYTVERRMKAKEKSVLKWLSLWVNGKRREEGEKARKDTIKKKRNIERQKKKRI